MIAAAPGTVAELQFRICDICSAADGAFVAVGNFGRFGLIIFCPVGVWLLLFCKGRLSQPHKVRQNMEHIAAEEQEVVEQGKNGEQIEREGQNDQIVDGHAEIEPCQILHLNGDDVEQQDPAFREHGGKGQKQAQVQKTDGGVDTQQEGADVRQKHAGQIEQVEAECAPGAFHHLAYIIVEEQGNGEEQNIGVCGQKHIGNKPPDLTPQNGGAVKGEKTVQHTPWVDYGEYIHNSGADGNIEHKVGNTLVLMPVAEPLKVSSKILQKDPSFTMLSLYLTPEEKSINEL